MKKLLTAITIVGLSILPALLIAEKSQACVFGMKCPKTPIPDPRFPIPSFPRSGGSSDSCLSVMTQDYYQFAIHNLTKNHIRYSINNDSFTLNPGYQRQHRYRKAYGTNSCNSRSYPQPRVRFDRNFASGFQAASFSIGQLNNYYFHQVGDELFLVDEKASREIKEREARARRERGAKIRAERARREQEEKAKQAQIERTRRDREERARKKQEEREREIRQAGELGDKIGDLLHRLLN